MERLNQLVTIKDEEYFKKDGFISSTLMKALFSGCSRNANIQKPKTEALKLGTKIHKFILEPEDFNKRYSLRPLQYYGKVKVLKPNTKATMIWSEEDQYEDWDLKKGYHRDAVKLQEEGDVEIVTQEEMISLGIMRDRLYESGLYNSQPEDEGNERTGYMDNGHAEKAVYTDFGDYKAKIKMDWYTEWDSTKQVIVDLKSCLSAHPKDVTRDICQYNYDLQGAFYKSVLKNANKENWDKDEQVDFIFLFVEKKAPYNVGWYRLTPQMEMNGLAKFDIALKHYKNTLKLGIEKGYKAEYSVQNLTLPEWAIVKK